MTTMHAVRIHAQGGPAVLHYEEAPRPMAAASEVLVRMHAAGVNPADWKTRAGFLPTRAPLTFPHILGWDVAGMVESVGEGVTSFAPGDAVYGLIRFPSPGATYAEYVAAPGEQLAHMPAGVTPAEAAALPLAALTAWQALFDVAHTHAGQTVLIHGATGGVGHLAVQLAKAQGANVLAVSAARHAEFVRRLGADAIIDPTRDDLETSAAGVDVVFDTVGGPNGPRFMPTMRRGGTYISIAWALPAPADATAAGITAQGLLVHPDAAALTQLAAWVTASKVRPVIEQVFPLSQARQAHAVGETGHVRGKLVLDGLAHEQG